VTVFWEKDSSADNFFEARKQEYLLLSASDITQMKRQQEQVRLNAMRALMAEQELVQSTRETMAGAIFQLQRPLNMIAAAENMLERRNGIASNEPLVDVLQQALASGREAMQILRASMPGELSEAATSVDVNQLLREVLSISTERLLARGVVVDWRPASVLPKIPAKELQLRGMFKQLVENALDALDENTLKRRELIISTMNPSPDIVEVIIEDSGPGIPEELRVKVFEPFFSTKSQGGNRAGMGLVMVQQVVNDHDGSIELGKAENGGCRIKLQFPINVKS
jgi:nitrogen fixation negative regulator NifL